MDQNYFDKLSPEEKKWLSQFNEEYYGNTISKNRRKAFHKTKKAKREIYRQTNARYRDIYNHRIKYSLNTRSTSKDDQPKASFLQEGYDPTDDVIEQIDRKNLFRKDDDES
jgi:hypothetical protein